MRYFYIQIESLTVLLYTIFTRLYKLVLLLASPFNDKARKWINGRKGVFTYLEKSIQSSDKVIWMHCASLGEFEQGRPVLETLKIRYPSYKILLTFFSPSGYEVRKNYAGADWICYLPMDSAYTAKRFLTVTHPDLVIFVKYEFWFYYLKKLKYSNTPLILISALFRKDMSFFKWHGALSRKMLTRFNHLFVQNQSSKDLLIPFGLENKTTVAGDTRFDRVIQVKEQFSPIEAIAHFIGESKVLIAGSTWPEDEEFLQYAFQQINLTNKVDLKLIIAPHEINPAHLEKIEALFENNYCRLSTYNFSSNQQCHLLLIDNFGMLSKLYHYATITYVGGGLKKSGTHNTLEAAVHGKPVLYGPNYKKHTETVGLANAGGGFPFTSKEELTTRITQLLTDQNFCKNSGEQSMQFVYEHKGATEKILGYIQENRLLTN